jgi:hypothetical protein
MERRPSKRRKIGTRALGAGAVMAVSIVGAATPAMALYPERHQFFPNNANPGAVSKACAILNRSNNGNSRSKLAVFGVASRRCSGSGGGYAWVYVYQSGTAVEHVGAQYPSTSVRTAQVASGGFAVCSIPSPNVGGHQGQNHA